MTPIIIIIILLFCYLLLATESLTNVNKAAVAIFAGTAGWVLHVGFTAQDIFLKYVGRASEIVLFLLATMTIVEILHNNGCFDFISQLLKTRSSKKVLWTLGIVTFILSANLDNLTTTVMMLTVMHKIIPNRRYRMIYGSVIVLAANCGGALTVIGDSTGLLLWMKGAVTPTHYSLSMLVPCLVAWLVPTWWIGRSLPERIETEWITMPYRGNDTNLNIRQRLLMLFVGIGGLWFIPSFHNITKLSPFLGALCVLSVLWIVNEIVNRRLVNEEQIVQQRMPRVLQYGVIKMILFVMGMMLAIGVVQETGAIGQLSSFIDRHIGQVWIVGAICAVISTIVDSFATAVGMLSLHSVSSVSGADYWSAFNQNGDYWLIIAYTSAVAGNILCIGSMSGLALVKAERIHVGWYFRNIGFKALLGALLGYIALYCIR